MIIFNTEDTKYMVTCMQMVLWISTEMCWLATTVSNYKYVSIPQPGPDQSGISFSRAVGIRS